MKQQILYMSALNRFFQTGATFTPLESVKGSFIVVRTQSFSKS